ncbi:MAG: response regulator [Sedimentisphaerales bacterium]|nr:response regulator [Sedimentisphaerales bacterium]
MITGSSERPKVLVAEDQPPSQKLICIHLEKLGFDVTAVSDGQEAVDTALAQPFDVIILDMQMPKVSGYEAASLMRKNGIDTPILALTAHAMSGDKEKCMTAGCNGYLAKPFRQEDLQATLAQLTPVG